MFLQKEKKIPLLIQIKECGFAFQNFVLLYVVSLVLLSACISVYWMKAGTLVGVTAENFWYAFCLFLVPIDAQKLVR